MHYIKQSNFFLVITHYILFHPVQMIYISILEDKLKLTIIQNGERVLGMSIIIIIFFKKN